MQRPRRNSVFLLGLARLGLPLELVELREYGHRVGQGALVQLRVADDAFFVDDHERAPGCAGVLVEDVVQLERRAVGPEIRQERVTEVAQRVGPVTQSCARVCAEADELSSLFFELLQRTVEG